MNSMTGYGTAEGAVGKGRLFVEIKSVNHRFNEVNVKISGKMSAIEGLIRKQIQGKFARGKIDVFFKEKESLFGGMTISIDTNLARRYQRILKNIRKELDLKEEIDFFQAVDLDKIIQVDEVGGSYEKLWAPISRLIERACQNVSKMRANEGAHILKDQSKRLKMIQSLIKKVRTRSGSVRNKQIERIRSKMNGTFKASDLDEQRLQMEAAYLGGRQDIAEELVRLESHTKQYRSLLKEHDEVGRKLDFLLQEMNREANTIGAKAADAAVSQMVVECKAELERLREQIQNIE